MYRCSAFVKNVRVGALVATVLALSEARLHQYNHSQTRCDSNQNLKISPKLVAHLDPSVSVKLRGTASKATYPANDPSEDRHVVELGVNHSSSSGAGWLSILRSRPNESAGWNFAAVFDGHGGWQVSQLASERLIKEVQSQLDFVATGKDADTSSAIINANVNGLKSGVVSSTPSGSSTVKDFEQTRTGPIAVERSVLQAFKTVEAEYLQKVRESYRLGFGEVAKVGCCALLAVHRGNELIIANCGDCRAVLGTAPSPTASNGKFFTTRLTHDHNARMPLELLTLQQEHPGEADIVVCKNAHACYVKGKLQLTRALGDAYLKYPEFNQPNQHRGRFIAPPYTPPYVKSTPDVHHVHLTADDKFVILASDGLWDFLSDEEAVAVVEQCLREGTAHDAASKLVQRALEVAAEECGLSMEKLRALPPGNSRRSRHDDTTAVVLYF